MSFEIFILVFFAVIFLGSLAVTGWYFITRGEEKILEDGSKKRTGKVFKNWFFFWTKTKDVKRRVWYDEAHLFGLYSEIKGKFVITKNSYDINQIGDRFVITQPQKYYEEMRWIENAFEVKFYDLGGNDYRVYKEYDDFVFPYWVRDPLAVCATCFSSIYGSIFYWILIALPKAKVFGWAHIPWLAATCFWIAFCFSLSVINTALAKRFN